MIPSTRRWVSVEGDGWRRRRRRWWWRHKGGRSSAPFANQTPVMSVYTASTPTASTAISPVISTTLTVATTATTTTTTTATAATSTTTTTAAVAAAAAVAAPVATTTATSSTATSSTATAVSPEAATDWNEFCERHARASASDFAKAFCAYVSLNLPESARANLSHRDFLKKFVESFCEHFESEYLRQGVRYCGFCIVIL